MMRGFYSISRNAFVEVVRQPIYAILLSVGLVLIAFSPVVTAYTMMDDVKLTVDMGLGTLFMIGLFLSVLGATQVISDEVESRTAAAVISKPVARVVFVLGKFAGVLAALAVAAYLLTLMLLMTVRMGVPTTAAFRLDRPVLIAQLAPFLLAVSFGAYGNYFHRSSFTSSALSAGLFLYTLAFALLLFVGRDWRFEWFPPAFRETDFGAVALACVVVFMGTMVMASVALAVSTRARVVANILICLTVFFVGMIAQYLFGWAADTEWVRWEPVNAASSVVVSGTIADERGVPVAGVRLRGAPPGVATDRQGRYEVTVRRGGVGELTPHRRGFTFRPSSRVYPAVEGHRTGQDFLAVARPAGVPAYAVALWTGVARAAYHVTPSLHLFWVGDQLMRPHPYVPAHYVVQAALYGLMWCAGMVALAAFLFEGREL